MKNIRCKQKKGVDWKTRRYDAEAARLMETFKWYCMRKKKASIVACCKISDFLNFA